MKNRNRYRLTEEHKVFVCQGVAEFKPWREIADQFLERFAAFVEGKENVQRWLMGRIEYYTSHRDAKKWQDLIQEMRKHWRAGILEEPLANVRERVRLLAKDVNRIEKRLKKGDETPGAVDVDDLTALMKEKREQLDQIAVQSGQKVAKSQQDVQMQAQVAAGVSVELRMPDFRQQETDGVGT